MPKTTLPEAAKKLRRTLATPYLVYACLLLVFITDTMTLLGFSHALIYTPFIVLAALIGQLKHLYIATFASITLTWTGYLFSSPEPDTFKHAYVVANRIGSMVALVLVALLCYFALRFQQRLASYVAKLRRQQRQLRRITRLTQIYEWHYKRSTDTLYLSQEAANHFALTTREVPRADFARLFFGRGRLMLEAIREQQTAENASSFENQEVEAVLSLPNQGKRYVRLLAHEAEHDSVAGIIQDISSQRDEALRLHAELERFKSLTDTVPIILWQADSNGEVYDANDSLSLSVGEENAERADRWLSLIHPDDQSKTLATWMRCVSTGQPFRMQYRLIHADGSAHWYLATAKAQRDAQGAVTGWVGATVDIGDLKPAPAMVR